MARPRRKARATVQETGWNDHRTGVHYTCPRLMIRGKWMEHVGFTPGTKVEIAVGDGILTVRKKELGEMGAQIDEDY